MSTKRKVKMAPGWRRGILWTLAGAVALLMACVAVYLAWRGFRLLTSDNLEASDTGAGIQGLAAAVNLMATLCLVGVTTAYAFIAYKHLRLSGPDVSIGWHLAWWNPGGPSREVLRAPIESLRNGPMAESHKAWFIAVELVNSGNQAVDIEQMLLTADDGFALQYGGSQLSRECPVNLGSHSSQALYFDQFAVRNFLLGCEYLKTPEPHQLQAHVHLGSGVSLSTSKVPLDCFQGD